jgi:hypothetical protein
MTQRPPVAFATVRKIALALPGVEAGTSFGTPAFHVRGKFLARLREDGETLVVKCDYRCQNPQLSRARYHYPYNRKNTALDCDDCKKAEPSQPGA